MRFLRLATLIGIGALVLGCGSDDSSGNDPNKDPATTDPTTTDPVTPKVAPAAAFSALTAYQGVLGQMDLAVQVSESVDKVELLVGGAVKATATAAPFTIAFDSTSADDGIAQLSLRAHAGDESADSEATPVVIYNNGAKATWKNGTNGGEMWIQPGVDAHLKYHWQMPCPVSDARARRHIECPCPCRARAAESGEYSLQTARPAACRGR